MVEQDIIIVMICNSQSKTKFNISSSNQNNEIRATIWYDILTLEKPASLFTHAEEMFLDPA